MIIKCKVHQCPYNVAEDCTKPLLTIDENGHCGQLWFKGRQRGPYALQPVEDRLKEFPIIEEVEYSNDDDNESCTTLFGQDQQYGEEDSGVGEEVG